MPHHPDEHPDSLDRAVRSLVFVLGELLAQAQFDFHWRKSHAEIATKHDLEALEKIMSTYSEVLKKHVATQNAFNDRLEKSIDGVVKDGEEIRALVEKLQASPGTVTAADQSTIDALEARTEALAKKLEALDALDIPVVPTPGPDPEPEPGPPLSDAASSGSRAAARSIPVGGTNPATGLPVVAEDKEGDEASETSEGQQTGRAAPSSTRFTPPGAQSAHKGSQGQGGHSGSQERSSGSQGQQSGKGGASSVPLE